MTKAIAAIALVLALSGCGPQGAQAPTLATAQATAATCPTGAAPMERFELYLGGSVGNNEWNAFLDTEVTTRFPRGFTVVDAHGQWQEMNGQISKEDTRILIVVVPNNVTAAAYIGAIAAAYDDRFDQETSLLVRASVCATFVTGTPD
jgi:hypothetical protein